jgi:hypothetical protein
MLTPDVAEWASSLNVVTKRLENPGGAHPVIQQSETTRRQLFVTS